jgi:Holliday junction resolvase RusA-like endonuclease
VDTRARGGGEVVIEFAGEPVGKARPRLGRHGVYTPRKTAAFETALAWNAKLAMRGRPLLLGPLRIDVMAVFAHEPTHKPDADNILKACMDAMQGVVFRDDAHVVDARVVKVQGSRPGLRIEVLRV